MLKSEVSRLVREQNLPSCPYDGKPCLIPHGNCVTEDFGFGLPDKKVWYCPRLYIR